jgi:hypothetical protein
MVRRYWTQAVTSDPNIGQCGLQDGQCSFLQKLKGDIRVATQNVGSSFIHQDSV